jgi:hypothetical protein
MLELENIERKFEHIVNSETWKTLEKLFNSAEFVFIFGNGGNMGVSDHAAIDMSRLTNKNVMCPGSGIRATSIIGDTNFEDWFKNWLEMSTRGIDKTKCLVIGLSCSTTGASSNSVVNACNWASDNNISCAMVAAQPKSGGLNKDVLQIIQHAKYYHTSEILSLALTYQLTHSAGFECPTISKKARHRRFEKLGIESEVKTLNQQVPPGMENQLNNLAIDFDGVVHTFDKGWYDGTCYGEPVEGALVAIKELSEKYNIIIFTAKVRPDRPLVNGKTGYELVDEWLGKYDVKQYIDEITYEKPRAEYYVDDKAIEFTNNWNEVKDRLI